MRLSTHCSRSGSIAALLLAAGCAVNPVSGKNELSLVSQSDEIAMGKQGAADVARTIGLYNDPAVQAYVSKVGLTLAKQTPRPDLPWQYQVVDDPAVNAFALPGGFVFVNRGLIERVDSLDELAGVLGHEIGHVTQRHSVKLQQKGEIAQIGTGLACVLTRVCSQAAGVGINASEGAMFAKFSRDAEHEADSVGMIYVVKAGIDPRGMTSMFEKLLAERQRSPEKLEAWFINHPIEEDRIGFTLDAIDKMDRQQLESLTRDTPNFRKFKKRFDALPPYPPQPAN